MALTMGEESSTRSLPWNSVVRALLLTVGAVVLVEVLSRAVLRVPTLTVLMAAVAYVAFIGGLRSGLVSAAVVSLYGVYYFSLPGRLFAYSGENLLRLFLLPISAGAIAFLVGIVRHSQLETEKSLRRQRDFSKAIDESLAEGVYALDGDGRVTHVNPTAQPLLGWREAELVGEIMHDVIHYRRPDGSPFPREECTGLVEVVTRGVTIRNDDDVFVRKGGEMFPVAYSSSPITYDGRVIGVVVAFRDITERKRAEGELEARVRQQAAIAMLGRWALANPDLDALLDEAVAVVARTLDVEYTKVLQLLPDRDALLLRAGVGWEEGLVGVATVRAGTDSQAGYTLMSGGPVIVEDLRSESRFQGPPLLHEHGVVSGMSVIIHGQEGPFGVLGAHTTRRRMFTGDDTYFLQAVANVIAVAIRRKDSEERLARETAEAQRLEELDRLRREFVSSVSHELRTPLTAIRSAIGMVGASAADRLAGDERRLLDNAGRNAQRLGRLIDDLLAYNQLEAGTLRLEREPLDLCDVVAEAVATLQPLIEEKGQSLQLDLPELLPADGDAFRLGQVVVNLLNNAHIHTPPGTHIAIAGRCRDGRVLLTVADDGPGVPPQHLEDIFERFRSLGDPTRGSGLGLAITRGIVTLHGGRVWAETGPRGGASFHMELPTAGMEWPCRPAEPDTDRV